MVTRKRTSIFVDTDFFNKTFEPGRKQAEQDLGIRLSQRKFTEMLNKNGFKFSLPKLNKKLKVNKRRTNEKSFTI